MDKPFPAYQGDDPYVFVSYAHKDAAVVYAEITRLHADGIRICYDEGISPGELFTDELADFIEGATCFLYFVTPNAVQSRNCLNEVQFATSRDKRIVAVHLEETDLPKGLELSIGLAQGILKHQLKPEDYRRKLLDTLRQVQEITIPTQQADQASTARPRLVLGVLVAAALAVLGWQYLIRAEQPAGPVVQFERLSAVAVLPFNNVGNDADQEYISDGLTIDIVGNLQKLRLFPVISHSSTFAYRDQPIDIKTVAANLGAAYIVEGTVRLSGEQLRVTAQLLDASNGHTVWSKTYDRKFEDLFSLQDEITRSIAASISPEIQRFEIVRAKAQPTENMTAYDLYLKGLRLAPVGPVQDVRAAREFLMQATELDPTFAQPWAQLAHIEHSLLTYYGSDAALRNFAEARQRALEFAERAVRIDPQLANGHVIKGHMLLHFNRVDEALEEYEHAMALSPSTAEAIGQYAWGLICAGRYEEGIDQMQKVKILSPNDPLMFEFLLNEAWAYAGMGEHEVAIELTFKSLTLKPDNLYGYLYLVDAYLETDQPDKARVNFEILVDRFSGFNTKSLEYSSIPAQMASRWSKNLASLGWKNPT